MRYTKADRCRMLDTAAVDPTSEEYRTPWRRDYARLIHCPSFRRLQGKTQLFPGSESDFFRNRLTHSLEVAQIAKSIALKLNHDLAEAGEGFRIEPDVVEFAGLAHDLGHPPFGHFGEEALHLRMLRFGGFEGNAQTRRLLTRIEKKHEIDNTTLGIGTSGTDRRVGLDLTARSLASVLKYDKKIPTQPAKAQVGPIKGYYASEGAVVEWIKRKVCGRKTRDEKFKTIECQIMDIADDIAYSTYDLEDSFKAGFLEPLDLLGATDELLRNVSEKVKRATGRRISSAGVREEISKRIFFDMFRRPGGIEDVIRTPSQEDLDELHFSAIRMATTISRLTADNGYQRVYLTSSLVNAFIRAVVMDEINRRIPALSTVRLEKDSRLQVEILKHFVYESQILSPKVQLLSCRSKEIIDTIFDRLSEPKDSGYLLLPPDYRQIYLAFGNKAGRMRTICDFIAGMTDRYAIEFYGRLTSEDPETIFKPF